MNLSPKTVFDSQGQLLHFFSVHLTEIFLLETNYLLITNVYKGISQKTEDKSIMTEQVRIR